METLHFHPAPHPDAFKMWLEFLQHPRPHYGIAGFLHHPTRVKLVRLGFAQAPLRIYRRRSPYGPTPSMSCFTTQDLSRAPTSRRLQALPANLQRASCASPGLGFPANQPSSTSHTLPPSIDFDASHRLLTAQHQTEEHTILFLRPMIYYGNSDGFHHRWGTGELPVRLLGPDSKW
jgi:hypothetical protein